MIYDQAEQRRERGCMYKLNYQRFSQLLWPSSGREYMCMHVTACGIGARLDTVHMQHQILFYN